jgi:hypothetical protein
MRDDHGIDVFGSDWERHPVTVAETLVSLKKPTIDEDPPILGTY